MGLRFWMVLWIFFWGVSGAVQAYTVSGVHPRIFLNPPRLAALQKTLPVDGDFKELKAHVDRGIENPEGTRKLLLGEMPDEVARRFLLVALITGEKKYQDAAMDVVLQVTGMPTADISGPGTGRTNYRRRNRLMAMALGYDWLHANWAEPEKTRIRDRMLEYLDSFDDPENHWDKKDLYIASPRDFASSGSSRVANMAGLAAVFAVHGEDPRFDAKERRIVENWEQGYNPAIAVSGKGGAHHMGWRYGAHYGTLKPYLIWNSATGGYWVPEYVHDLPYMYLYGVNSSGILPMSGDCRDNKIQADLIDNVAISVLLAENGHAAWFGEKYFGSVGAMHKPLYLISRGAKVEARPPDDLPLARHFEGTGFVIARSSWKEDAAILTFKSSPFASRTHRHADENSFILDYRGSLLTDSGFYDEWNTDHWNHYYSRSIAHNTLVVRPVKTPQEDGGQRIPDTREPLNARELQEDVFALGGVKAFSQNGAAVWIRGDAARAYDADRVTGFERDILLVHQPEGLQKPALLTVDRVRLPEARKPVLLWHVKKEPVFSGKRSQARIRNGGGGHARLEFADVEALEIQAIGGAGREFEVNGIQYPHGDLKGMSGGDPGQWGRIEVATANAVTDQVFTTLILVDDEELTPEKQAPGRFVSGENWRGVRIGEVLLLVAWGDVRTVTLGGGDLDAVRGARVVHLAGVAPREEIRLETPLGIFKGRSDSEGLLSMGISPAEGFSVRAQAGPGGAVHPESLEVPYGESGLFVLEPEAGHVIVAAEGCGGRLSGNTYKTGTITEACAIEVSFGPESYRVRAEAGPGGAVRPESLEVPYGESGHFVVEPEAGHAIVAAEGCGGQLSGNTYRTGAITEACTITVSFGPESYAVRAEAGPGGTVQPESLNVRHGEEAAFTLTPEPGYRIAAVSGCGGSLSGNQYVTSPIVADCRVEAAFITSTGPVHTVRYVAGPHGMILGRTTQILKEGTDGSMVTALADGGYRFAAWSDGLKENPRREKTLESDRTVTAIFERIPLVFLDDTGTATNRIVADRGDRILFSVEGGMVPTLGPVLLNGEPLAHASLLEERKQGHYALRVTQTGLYEILAQSGGEGARLQIVVYPQAGFVLPGQKAAGGTKVRIRLYLDGKAPAYPVRVPFEAEGSLWVLPEEARSGEVHFEKRTEGEKDWDTAEIVLDLREEAVPSDRLVFRLGTPVNARKGASATYTLTFAQAPLPPMVHLGLSQNDASETEHPVTAFVQDRGMAVIASTVSGNGGDSMGLIYHWSVGGTAGSDPVNLSENSSRFVFDPSRVAPGLYQAMVRISGFPGDIHAEAAIAFRVLDVCPAPHVSVDGCGISDRSGNRIPDGLESPGLLPHALPLAAEEGEHAEAVPGLKLRLGTVAWMAGKGGMRVSGEDVALYGGNAGSPAPHPVDRLMTGEDDYADFEITGLESAGQSVRLVLPIWGDARAGDGGLYRVHSPARGWFSFVTDDHNRIASARRLATGSCPAVDAADYVSGLTAEAECLLLEMEDGGPNDRDGDANGMVSGLGRRAFPLEDVGHPENGEETPSPGGSAAGSGGCFLHTVWLSNGAGKEGRIQVEREVPGW